MLHNWVFWVQVTSLGFVCVSIPIYIAVIATILLFWKKEAHFRNSFFKLWIILGVTDLSHAITFWFSGKIPLMGVASEFFLTLGRGPAKGIMVFVFATHFGQVFLVVLLSLNRLSALLVPSTSEHLWSKMFVIPSLVVLCAVLSLALSSPIALMDMDWHYTNNGSKIAFHFLSTELAAHYMFWVAILLAVVTTFVVSIYAVMFYKVHGMPMQQQKALRTQIKLAFCAFMVASFMALLALCFCIFSFYRSDLLWGDNAVLFFVSCDLNSFCNAYVLLCTSKVVRKHLAHLFRGCLFITSITHSINQSTNNKKASSRLLDSKDWFEMESPLLKPNAGKISSDDEIKYLQNTTKELFEVDNVCCDRRNVLSDAGH